MWINCRESLFSLYGHPSQAIAPRYGVCAFNSACEIEYPIEESVEELLGCQVVAKQCMIATIRHQVL